MGYYLRILGTEDPDIHLDELSAALSKAGLTAELAPEAGGLAGGAGPVGDGGAGSGGGAEERAQRGEWEVIGIANEQGEALARLERNPVVAGAFGQQELDEFRKLIRDAEPLPAVQWLMDYFDRVKVIYAFRILDAALKDDNFEVVTTLRLAIWDRTGGILQADEEGFSNDLGFHILWQFPETASGDKYCAVLDEKGGWQRFRMDLGDPFQRMAFRGGEVPQTAVRL